MPSSSIKQRFLFSVGANVVRAAVGLVTGLLVARGLGPTDFGNLAYLLGSFLAIRALLDMGASSAFYTFIAQRHRTGLYYVVYLAWLAFQFLFTAALVALLLPADVIDHFWLGQERETILLALLATFLQNQVWQTVVQLHEAVRKTIRVQMAGLLIVVVHLILVVLMFFVNILSIQALLQVIAAEYLVATLWLSKTLRKAVAKEGYASSRPEESSLQAVLADYLHYCKPMVVIAVFAFCYEIADRWLLQRYGGASQQGFYQVASQLSAVSLLATTSILNILWKEVAEASDGGNHAKVVALRQKTTRLLVLLAAAVACFLAPWAEQLVNILLGNEYHAAWPVLFVMLFYPIHQSMGQVNATLFMATGQNSTYMKITVAGLLASIPISYVLIAPEHGALVPGLEMGAMGLALKIVGMNILFVNIQSWVIARHYGIEFQWRYQVSIILSLLAMAYGSQFAVQEMIPGIQETINGATKHTVLIGMLLAGLIYLAGVFVLISRAPSLAGLDCHEVGELLSAMRNKLRRGK